LKLLQFYGGKGDINFQFGKLNDAIIGTEILKSWSTERVRHL